MHEAHTTEENNIEKTSRTARAVKRAVIGVIGIGLALLLGFSFSQVTQEPALRTILVATAIAIVWLSVLVIQYIAFHSFRIALLFFMFQAGAILVFLVPGASVHLLTAAALLVVFMVFGYMRARSDLDQYLAVRFFRIASHGTSLAITGFVLFLTVYSVGLFDVARAYIPPRAVEIVLRQATPIVHKIIPGFSEQARVTDVLRTLAETKVPRGVAGRDAALQAIVAELVTELERIAKTPLESGETVSNFVARALSGGIRSVAERSEPMMLVLIGVLLFVALKSAAFFVGWVVVGLSFVIYQILLVFGILFIGFENRSKEVILIG